VDYKIIVAGTRTFNDYELLEANLINILKGKRPSEVTIVSGGARGADSLGEKFARKYNCWLKIFPAEWDRYGKSAGYIRNADMAKFADACIVFWDGVSKGTKHMIDLADKHNLNLYVVMY